MANRVEGFRIRFLGDEKAIALSDKRVKGIIEALRESGQEVGLKIRGDAKRIIAWRPRPIQDSRMPARPRTNRLGRAITSFVERGASGVRVVIGVLGTVAYGRIQEMGGKTAAHDIRPVRKKSLRFADSGYSGSILLTRAGKASRKMKGAFIFTKLVHHPGSNIPARPYLMPAVERNLGMLRQAWEGAVAKGLKEGASGG